MFETAEQPVWLTGCSLATRTDELQPFNSTSEFAGTAGGEERTETQLQNSKLRGGNRYPSRRNFRVGLVQTGAHSRR